MVVILLNMVIFQFAMLVYQRVPITRDDCLGWIAKHAGRLEYWQTNLWANLAPQWKGYKTNTNYQEVLVLVL